MDAETMQTQTLAEFLLARIADLEAIARRYRLRSDIDGTVLFDPARVLAECEAKRRIVAYADTMTQLDRDRSRTRTGDAWVVLTALALPYADHESYREEWKP